MLKRGLLSLVLVTMLVGTFMIAPQGAHATTNSGSIGSVEWETEIRLQTVTSVFGKYVRFYGRTKATGDPIFSGLEKVEIRAQLRKGGTVVSDCEDEGARNVVTNVAQKSCEKDYQLTAPDNFKVETFHRMTRNGTSELFHTMASPVERLGP